MVLENLVNAYVAEKQSWKLFLLGMAYATVGMIISFWVFREYASMVMVFLTALASAHIMHSLIELEEEEDEQEGDERKLLEHHSYAIKAFMAIFLGFTVAFTFWYAVLGFDYTNIIFKAQNDTVARITGLATQGYAVSGIEAFNMIFSNNIRVLFFALLFSFIYGYGAIFILAWNASVIAAAAGASFKAAVALNGGAINVIVSFINSLGQYALHGIPEILAYFVAALASGILGIALARKVWKDPEKFRTVIIDFIDLTVISVIILFIAAILEVWVTPLIMF